MSISYHVNVECQEAAFSCERCGETSLGRHHSFDELESAYLSFVAAHGSC